MKELALLLSEGKGKKDEWANTWGFCSCTGEFEGSLGVLSAKWQTSVSAAAQDPRLIISSLSKCSGIRVWMLARCLGKDFGYITSPDSQGEEACGLLCGKAAGYKAHLWCWVQGKQALRSILAGVPILLGQPCWQRSQREEIMSPLYCHCLPWYPGTSCVRQWRTAGSLGMKRCLPGRRENILQQQVRKQNFFPLSVQLVNIIVLSPLHFNCSTSFEMWLLFGDPPALNFGVTQD